MKLDQLNKLYLAEGTWSAPQTSAQAKRLVTLLRNPMPAGQAEDMLYDLMGDDELFDRIDEIENEDPDTDVRHIVLRFLKKWVQGVKTNSRGEDDRNNGWVRPWSKESLRILRRFVASQ